MAGAFDDKTEWVNIIFWDKLAETVGEYCKKGSFIEVVGRIQTRSWEKDGVTRYKTEIVANDVQFLDHRSREGQKEETGVPADLKPADPVDDDVPF